MSLSKVLDRFIERCPAGVMVRATIERVLGSERLNEIFESSRGRQYERTLVCSELISMMMGVATRTHRSVHAGYLATQEKLGVSVNAVYGKLMSFDPSVTAAIVRETAVDMATVIHELPKGHRVILKGYEVYLLDGNHLAATEHRLDVLRRTQEAPLPGQTLVLLDGQTELVRELVPCECGHAQERSLLPEMLERIRAETVIVADRNFCTTQFLFGLFRRNAYFIIRQHALTLTYDFKGKRRKIGRCKTGMLYEQMIVCREPGTGSNAPSEQEVRRITLILDTPTESGETEIHMLTNLPAKVSAKQIAETYRLRWTIEGAFQTMTDVLRCEVETLGYPKAALFSFAMAVLAWNAYAVVQAALRSVHGAQRIDDELSDEHFIRDVVLTQTGMDIAVDPSEWDRYRKLSAAQFAKAIERLAEKIDLSRYPKKKRGPKKPRPKRTYSSKTPHVSIAKLLDQKKSKKNAETESTKSP